jgi:hypothetical protein
MPDVRWDASSTMTELVQEYTFITPLEKPKNKHIMYE